MAPRRKFKRHLGERRYKKLFILAVENAKTEPQYFNIFNNFGPIIRVQCLIGRNDSSPPQVLRRMEKYLYEENLMASDEAWLVVDKDNWTDDQLSLLHSWSQTKDNYGFALSNPKFEYWLLLHFEDGAGVNSAHDCFQRLIRHLPKFDKSLDTRKFSEKMVNRAIERARQKDTPPSSDWPRIYGSTVYKLVENILNVQIPC